MILGALSRNFFSKQASTSPRSDEDGSGPGCFVSSLDEAEKTAKTKSSFRHAKRNASHGMA
jgi:hypothetical protein